MRRDAKPWRSECKESRPEAVMPAFLSRERKALPTSAVVEAATVWGGEDEVVCAFVR